jgi:hypothetical protein
VALQTLNATPREGMPSDSTVNSYFQPNNPAMIESQTIIQPKQGSLRWAKPLDTEEQRPLAGVSQPSWRWPRAWRAIISAHFLTVSRSAIAIRRSLDHYQMVAAELEHRGTAVNNTATNDNIPSGHQPERSSDHRTFLGGRRPILRLLLLR